MRATDTPLSETLIYYFPFTNKPVTLKSLLSNWDTSSEYKDWAGAVVVSATNGHVSPIQTPF